MIVKPPNSLFLVNNSNIEILLKTKHNIIFIPINNENIDISRVKESKFDLGSNSPDIGNKISVNPKNNINLDLGLSAKFISVESVLYAILQTALFNVDCSVILNHSEILFIFGHIDERYTNILNIEKTTSVVNNDNITAVIFIFIK